MSTLQKSNYSDSNPSFMSGWFWANGYFQAKTVSVAADRYTILSPSIMQVDVGGKSLTNTATQTLDLSVATNWDDYYNDSDWDSTNYTTVANRVGKDFYIYACQPVTGTVPKFLVSTASTYPIGYTAATSRKIGGFHCFCASMSVPTAWAAATAYILGQTIIPTAVAISATPALANYWYRCIVAGTSHASTQPTWNQVVDASPAADGGVTWICEPKHSLANYVAGDILPMSVWDLRFRSGARDSSGTLNNAGQVYDSSIQKWVGIYLPTVSAGIYSHTFGGTIADTITWNDAVDAAATLGMRLARDSEFQQFSYGSNQLTNIYGGADPATVTGAIDTSGRRLVSNIGVEGCVGIAWQWLDEQGYRFDAAASHTHGWTVSGAAQTDLASAVASGDLAPAWAWHDPGGSKGQVYTQGTYGDTKLLAGGQYDTAASSGSMARDMKNGYRWTTAAGISFRLVAKHIVKEFV